MGTETFFFVAQGSPMTKNQASVKNLINLGIRSRTRKYYHGILFSRKKCLQKRYSFAPPLTIRPCALLNKNNDIALSLFFKMGNE